MVIEVNKKTLVIQSNRLVEAKYRLSVEEQKIIKILVSQIQRDDHDFKDYEFRSKDLAELLGMEHSNAYGVLRNITKKLMSRVLEFYNPETNTLLQTSWLSSASYKQGEGTIVLRFDPSLKPLLLQLQSYFTKYELSHVLRFKGQYTIRFFEFRKSFLGRNKKIIVFPLEELREIFGLQKDEYKDFDNFRRRVLEPARRELLEKMSESFTWESIRRGRGAKVVSVKITFDDRNTEDEDETEEAPPLLRQEETENNHKQDISKSCARAALLRCGVSLTLVEELIARYEEPYILEKIAITEAHPEYVKNAAGFVITALQENWKDAEIEEQRRAEERRHEEAAKRERETRLRAIKQGFEMHAKNHALRQYEQLPTATQHQLKEAFLGTLSGILAKRYANKPEFGFEDPYYRAFVMKHKLSALALDDYLQEAGLSLSSEDTRILQAL